MTSTVTTLSDEFLSIKSPNVVRLIVDADNILVESNASLNQTHLKPSIC